MNRVYNEDSIYTNTLVINKSANRTSYHAFATSLLNNYSLFDFQCIDILRILAVKQALINYDTGMGKTIMASAIMKALNNKDKTKSIFIMKSTQIAQTPKKIKDATGLKCEVVTGEKDSIDRFINKTMYGHDILIMSKSALQNPDFAIELYRRKKIYNCIIVDEIHEMTNFQSANTSSLLKAILPHFEYRIGLTATTITSEIDQLANAMYMLVRQDHLEPRKCIDRMLKGGEPAEQVYFTRLYKRTRRELNINSDYRPYLIKVHPDEYQVAYTQSGFVGKHYRDDKLFEVMKGPKATRQLEALKRVVTNRNDKGIIYIRLGVIRDHVYEELKKAGVRVACIYGKTTLNARNQIFKAFASGQLDVIITSVTTSLDIEADYVVFYEFTHDVYQLIGRADRGIKDKRLDIYFIITVHTGEVDFFLENIYDRSLLIRHVFRMEPNFVDRVKEMM